MTAWFSAPLSVVLALSTAAPPEAECGSDLACVAKANAAAARHASPADKASLLFTAGRSRLALFRTTGEAAQLCHARRLVVRSAALPHEHLGDRPAETRREIDAELKRLGHECRQRSKAAAASPDPGPPSVVDAQAQSATAVPPAPSDAPENDDVAGSSASTSSSSRAERPAAQEPAPSQEAAPSLADDRLLSARPTATDNVEREISPTTIPEGPAPQPAPKDSPSPRRPHERVIAGSALAAIGTGLGAGALAGLVGHLRAKATIAEINATLVAEDRAPTTEEIELGIDANDRYKQLGTVALTLAIVGSVSLITGLAVALAPERATSRARIRASGAGLVYSF